MKRLLNIEVTSYCYADCLMCPRDEVKSLGYIEMNTIDQIVEKVNGVDLWEISISGRGEPLLHPDLELILKKLKQLNCPISIVSTGTYLNSENLDPIIEHIDKLRLSVSSIKPSVFKQIHRGLDYDKTWANIKEIIDIASDKLVIHLVGGEIIFDGLEETVEYLRDRGVEELYLMPLWNRAGELSQSADVGKRLELIRKLKIMASENEYLNEDKKIANEQCKYCSIGDSSLSINYKGELVGCFQDFANENILGDLRSDNLYTLIENRRKILGKMNICRECNSAQAVIWN